MKSKLILSVFFFVTTNINAQEVQSLKSLLSDYLIDSWLECVSTECVDYQYNSNDTTKVMLVKVPDCNVVEEGKAIFLIVEDHIKHFEEIEFDQNFIHIEERQTSNSFYTYFFHYSSIRGDIKYYFIDLTSYKSYETVWLDGKIKIDDVNFNQKRIFGKSERTKTDIELELKLL
ncbi:hypothetical protein [Flammeovirga sp. OC4]|uniref:hypothetical protein n=1 Tax=Flammeovirga sp. OC4 TaxID=1382345 RepID=UPI0005C73E8A|nr:hypothetical protein [Flammeovirga sp. OC4]